MSKIILIIGAFDSKGPEYAFLREQILAQGHAVLTMNTGVLGGTDLFPVDVEADDVAKAGGIDLAALRVAKDRGEAMKVMAAGAPVVTKRLFDQGRFHGVIGMGGHRRHVGDRGGDAVAPGGRAESVRVHGRVRRYLRLRGQQRRHHDSLDRRRGRHQPRLARDLHTAEATGSSPVSPTTRCCAPAAYECAPGASLLPATITTNTAARRAASSSYGPIATSVATVSSRLLQWLIGRCSLFPRSKPVPLHFSGPLRYTVTR